MGTIYYIHCCETDSLATEKASNDQKFALVVPHEGILKISFVCNPIQPAVPWERGWLMENESVFSAVNWTKLENIYTAHVKSTR